jgi:hypothetical protein
MEFDEAGANAPRRQGRCRMTDRTGVRRLPEVIVPMVMGKTKAARDYRAC